MPVEDTKKTRKWTGDVADIRRSFHAEGVTINQWSQERGFSPALVYVVARGKRKCLRGQSHQIAIALGLKTH